MKKLIAFCSQDMEGDAWSEEALLFEDGTDLHAFFAKDNAVLKELFADGGEIKDLKIHDNNPARYIDRVTFRTKYAGDVVLSRLSAGYIINPKPTES